MTFLRRRVLVASEARALGPGRAAARVTWSCLLAMLLAACYGLNASALSAESAPTEVAATRTPAATQTSQPTVDSIAIGFAGRYKVGFWTPLEVTVRGGARPLKCVVELTVPDGDGVPSRFTGPMSGNVTIAAGELVTVRLYAKVGQRQGPMVVGIRAGEQLLATRTFEPGDESLAGVLPSNRGLLLALGGPLTGADKPTLEQRQFTVADVSDLKHLPDDWWGYDGVDTVVLATHDAAFVARLLAARRKLAALGQWVRMGGRLVLSVGKLAEQVLADDSPIAPLVPGHFETLAPLRQTTPFESYAETSDALEMAPGFGLQVPKLQDVVGRIEAYAGGAARDLPLVVRSPLGFGEVVFLAFDMGEPPFAGWRARPLLVDRVLRRAAVPDSTKATGAIGQVTTLGFEDLTGQLRGALDQFAGVTLVPFWLVALLVFAYVLCIGPLDYYLVRRVLGRMEATWFTFSFTVVAFCAGAYFLAYGLKGDQLRINRIDVVDFDASTQLVRGTSWINLFSPKTDTYDLELRPEAFATAPAEVSDTLNSPDETAAAAETEASSGVLFSWLGLPGSGFGGMDPASGNSPLSGDSLSGGAMFTEPYDYARELNGLRRMPIAVWSSKALVGRWWARGAAGVEADLNDTGRLNGSLTNRLGIAIPDGLLLFDRWAFPIRDWKAGQTLDVQLDLDQQTVETYLRHMAALGDRNVTPPYDRASFDIRRIVEILSAHELAGGAKYTGLAHDYQGFFDMSRLVANRRAVLLVRVDRPAATLERDGKKLTDDKSEPWTFFRYVFEVEGE